MVRQLDSIRPHFGGSTEDPNKTREPVNVPTTTKKPTPPPTTTAPPTTRPPPTTAPPTTAPPTTTPEPTTTTPEPTEAPEPTTTAAQPVEIFDIENTTNPPETTANATSIPIVTTLEPTKQVENTQSVESKNVGSDEVPGGNSSFFALASTVGIGVLLLAFVIVLFIVWRRRNKRRRDENTTSWINSWRLDQTPDLGTPCGVENPNPIDIVLEDVEKSNISSGSLHRSDLWSTAPPTRRQSFGSSEVPKYVDSRMDDISEDYLPSEYTESSISSYNSSEYDASSSYHGSSKISGFTNFNDNTKISGFNSVNGNTKISGFNSINDSTNISGYNSINDSSDFSGYSSYATQSMPSELADSTLTSGSSLMDSKLPEDHPIMQSYPIGREGANSALIPLLINPNINDKKIPMNELTFIKAFATGTRSEIWLCTYNNKNVAVKRLLPQARSNPSELKDFVEEARVTATLHHPNIVSFIGMAWNSPETLSIILEYEPQGEVYTFLHGMSDESKVFKFSDDRISWSRGEKFQMAIGVAKALQYLHNRHQQVVHRNICTRNMLLTQDLDIKLIDFGSDQPKCPSHLTVNSGAPYWSAPELLKSNSSSDIIPLNGNEYKCDIYSFGIFLIELDTCRIPFADSRSRKTGHHLSYLRLLEEMAAGNVEATFTQNCPQAVIDLAYNCIQLDPNNRPDAKEIIDILQEAKSLSYY